MIETILIGWSIGLVVMAFGIILSIRNERVLQERLKIIDMVSKQAQWIMECGIGDFNQPYDYYHSVSYDEMLYKFWRPVNSFYDYEKLSVPN